jgi:hypothetical protein
MSVGGKSYRYTSQRSQCLDRTNGVAFEQSDRRSGLRANGLCAGAGDPAPQHLVNGSRLRLTYEASRLLDAANFLNRLTCTNA